ncbi:hypothetical protein FOA52_001318 [Chlamydomonas sp. UWO 241]|nr:hypothetical protein FOA52_001318 [Chlamydomonas sp. UWO 241]
MASLGPLKRRGSPVAMGLFWLLIGCLLLLLIQQRASRTRLRGAVDDAAAAADSNGVADLNSAAGAVAGAGAGAVAGAGRGAGLAAGNAPHPESLPLLHPTAVVQSADKCHTEENNEYHGDVVTWGESNKQTSAAQCCQSCSDTPRCNVWVWCGVEGGCGGGAASYQACWLKKVALADLLEHVVGRGHAGIAWTAGAVYTSDAYDVASAVVQAKAAVNANRIAALRADEGLPLVYLDVSIDGKPATRIEAVLFMRESPLASENMRQFCTGEKGPPYHLKGSYFYRILDRFIDQTGVEAMSIYGHPFKDDPGGLKLQHDRPYLLSIANNGHNTNTAHFSITCAPAHHLDGSYVMFGECVSGFDTIEAINAMSRGQPNNALLNSRRAQITDSGELRRGTYRAPPGLEP